MNIVQECRPFDFHDMTVQEYGLGIQFATVAIPGVPGVTSAKIKFMIPLTPLPDGNNTTFLIDTLPVTNKVAIFCNKIVFEGVDYEISGRTVEFYIAPDEGDKLYSIYIEA